MGGSGGRRFFAALLFLGGINALGWWWAQDRSGPEERATRAAFVSPTGEKSLPQAAAVPIPPPAEVSPAEIASAAPESTPAVEVTRPLQGTDVSGERVSDGSPSPDGTLDEALAEVAPNRLEDYFASDFRLTVKDFAKGGMLVWTTSLTEATPLPDVRVQLRTAFGEVAAAGITDVDGLCFLDVPNERPGPDSRGGPALLVVASKDGDLAYVEPGRPLLQSPEQAFIFTERQAYRPGDTVRLWGLVRTEAGPLSGGDVSDGDFSDDNLSASELTLETLRPDGRRLLFETVKLSPAGFLSTSISLPGSVAAGFHRTRLFNAREEPSVLAATSFCVEPVPERFHLEIQVVGETDSPGVVPPRLRSGETVEFVVKGTHAHGFPARDGEVEAVWTVSDDSFEPREWRGFHFGEVKHFGGFGAFRFPSLRGSEVEAFDEDGEARFRIKLPGAENASPLQLRFAVAVRRSGRSALRTEVVRAVDPAPYYLGLHPEKEGILPLGEPCRFECVALRPDGSPAHIDALDLVLWSVGAEMKEVSTRRVVLSAGRGGFELTFTEPGSYRLRLRDVASMAVAERSLLVRDPGAGPSEDPRGGAEPIELRFARADYRPGDTARVTVLAPFSGTLLLTTETDRVETSRVLEMPDPEIEIPVAIAVEAHAAPYVAAYLVSNPGAGLEGADLRSPAPRIARGVALIPVDFSSRRLTLTLEEGTGADDEAALGTRGRVHVRVVAADGSPVDAAEVLISAVDERTFSSGFAHGFEMPTPFEFFYGARRHRVNTYTSRRPARPRRSPTMGALTEHRLEHGFDTFSVATRVQPVVISLGPLTTDADGRVEASFGLPPSAGDLRVYAVAAAGNRFGSTVAHLPAKGSSLELSLPSFLFPGDFFFVTARFSNPMATSRVASLDWHLDGLREAPEVPGPGTKNLPGAKNLVFAALREESLELAAGSAARTKLRLRATKPSGMATVRLECSFDAGKPAKLVRERRIPLRQKTLPVERLETGIISPGKTLAISPEASCLPGTSTYELILSRSPAVELAGPLRFLLECPHASLEATVSRLFPLLYLHELVRTLSPTPAQDLLGIGVRRVFELQAEGGWLGNWPGSRHPGSWGNIYAAHFLLEARAAGYEVPSKGLEALLRYVEEEIVIPPRPEGTTAILEEAYGLYVLALAGRPLSRSLEQLRERVEKQARQRDVSASARCLLAGAFQLAGDAGVARALLDQLFVVDISVPGAVMDSGGALRSPARETAIALWILIEVNIDSAQVPELVERLKGYRVDGRWATTQENAFALLALAKHANPGRTPGFVFQGPHPPSTWDSLVTPRVGGESAPLLEVGESRILYGRDMDHTVTVSLSRADTAPPEDVLYYSFFHRGVPERAREQEVDEGLKVRRRFLDRDLSPVHPSAIPLGKGLIVELELDVEHAVEHVVVTDLLPAGFEVEDLHVLPLADTGSQALRPPALESPPFESEGIVPEHVSHADGRVTVYCNLSRAGKRKYVYAARAVRSGEFHVPPVRAHALYAPGTKSVWGAGSVVVK